MKRHESLAPLSREHHNGLILAQLLKKDAPLYPGLPAALKEKATYALQQFDSLITPHFAKEDRLFHQVSLLHPQLHPLIEEVLDEHLILRDLFERLRTAPENRDVQNEIGLKLSAHIRKEERILFQEIQSVCSEVELGALAEMLQ